MSPFDILNAINFTKENVFVDPQVEKEYKTFLINRGLSYFPDTVMYANEMNRYSFLDKEVQFNFLLHAIPKRKRFSKWAKKDSLSDQLSTVMQCYKYSEAKALEAMSLLSDEQITIIEDKMRKGGKND